METKTLTSAIVLTFLITGSSAIAVEDQELTNEYPSSTRISKDLTKEVAPNDTAPSSTPVLPTEEKEATTATAPADKGNWALWLMTFGYYGRGGSSVIPPKVEKIEDEPETPILTLVTAPIAPQTPTIPVVAKTEESPAPTATPTPTPIVDAQTETKEESTTPSASIPTPPAPAETEWFGGWFNWRGNTSVALAEEKKTPPADTSTTTPVEESK